MDGILDRFNSGAALDFLKGQAAEWSAYYREKNLIDTLVDAAEEQRAERNTVTDAVPAGLQPQGAHQMSQTVGLGGQGTVIVLLGVAAVALLAVEALDDD